jgi:hypothetical protein
MISSHIFVFVIAPVRTLHGPLQTFGLPEDQ